MLVTRTGNFPIGIRRMGSPWQKDLPALAKWAIENSLGVIDVGADAAHAGAARQAGLQIGSIDLPLMQPMLSPDAAERSDAVAQNSEFITAGAAAGARNFFTVMLPTDAARPRRENFGYMVESLNGITGALEEAGAYLVIEGWPGPGALCCTPETYRATFRECPSQSIGINYDPSHLLRMGIDPIRFLNEFAPRVRHMHGKDAEILNDDLYEYGHEQPATFKVSPGYGQTAWRYTIPGHGGTHWTRVFELLEQSGYQGAISIELEDKNYNGSEAGEKAGFLAGAGFLSSC